MAAEIFAGATDKGLEGVVACTTGISSIMDVTLCYRGYTIEQLAENSTFEEVVYLLWNDKLPGAQDLQAFQSALRREMALEPAFVAAVRSLPTKGVHPMAWLRTAVSMLAHFDAEAQSNDKEAQKRVALRLTGKMASLVALFDRLRSGKDYVAPRPEKSLAWNFLFMLKGTEPDEQLAKIFDTCLILHADHELNCSAFAARVTASSLSDIYSAVVSGIGALKGPLHGGANEQVMRMLIDIGTVEKAKTWVKGALARKEKVMGFGHRVYKNGDPRARILMQMSEILTKKMGMEHYYQMSKLIDDTVQSDKSLLPNVDFYSATVYHAMGIPIDLFTPVFAASRISGWLAHVFEQWTNNRIYRPRGQWVGKSGLQYLPIAKR